MKEKLVSVLLISSLIMAFITGCGNNNKEIEIVAQPVAESETPLAESAVTNGQLIEGTAETELLTEENPATKFVLNTTGEDGNKCYVLTKLDYVVEDTGDGKKTYTVNLNYTQEESKPFLLKVAAFDTSNLIIIKTFDDTDGETTEGEIKSDDKTYNYSAIVNKEIDKNGIVAKETLTLTVDSEYEGLGLWISAYEDKTYLGDEKRFEIK